MSNRPRTTHETRSRRERRDFLRRLGVWIFIFAFVLSAGGIMVFSFVR